MEELETIENTDSKFTSRKFIVWLMACVILIFCMVFAFYVKDAELVKLFMPYWSYISIFYIGGNVAKNIASNLIGGAK